MSELTVKNKSGVPVADKQHVQLAQANFEQAKTIANSLGDEFIPREKIDASSDGKFTSIQAIKKFFEGIIMPVKAIWENPLIALGLIGIFAGIAIAVPAITPVLLIGGGVLSLFEIGKGGIKFALAAANGDGDGMENAFKDIGSGTIGTALTLIGVKGSGLIAVEAKATTQALKAGATETEAVIHGLKASKNAKSMTFTQALKENLSMVSKDGLSSVKNSYKLRGIKRSVLSGATNSDNGPIYFSDDELAEANYINRNFLFEDECTRESIAALPKERQHFLRSLSRAFLKQRRLTDDDILRIANEIYNKELTRIAKNVGISKEELAEIAPEIKLDATFMNQGGKFNHTPLELELNPEAIRIKPIVDGSVNNEEMPAIVRVRYKDGLNKSIDCIVDFVSHESAHMENCLFRLFHLTKEEQKLYILRDIIRGVKHGYPKRLLQKANFFGSEFMTHPKMSAPMRKDLSKFIEAFLKDPFAVDKENTIRSLLSKHPDFLRRNGIENMDDAVRLIVEYSDTQCSRYKYYCDYFCKVYDNKELMTKIKAINVTSASRDKAKAYMYTRGAIETADGNAGIQGMFKTNEDFVFYKNSLDEVIARMHGTLSRLKHLSREVNSRTKAIGTEVTIEEATNIEQKLTLLRGRLKVIEKEILNESSRFKNPDYKFLQKKLDKITEMIRVLKQKLYSARESLRGYAGENIGNASKLTKTISHNYATELAVFNMSRAVIKEVSSLLDVLNDEKVRLEVAL